MKDIEPRPPISLAFETTSLRIPVAEILPLKELTQAAIRPIKYTQIAASIAELGLIEPPVVIRDREDRPSFICSTATFVSTCSKKLGQTEVVCLVATEDEAFTYNRRISRLATIQEHKMILTAIEKGVSEERIARVLHFNASSIRQKKNLLEGICPEAVELFKDKHVPINTLVQFKKMKPLRQIESSTDGRNEQVHDRLCSLSGSCNAGSHARAAEEARQGLNGGPNRLDGKRGSQSRP